jgi:hypothetical protein
LRFQLYNAAATTTSSIGYYSLYGVYQDSSNNKYGAFNLDFSTSNINQYEITVSSGSQVVPEAITFSKTKLFIGGHKEYSGYKCPVIGRLTTALAVEYLYSYDCSSTGYGYNVLWIDRWLDELLDAGTTDKVIAMAQPMDSSDNI